MANMNSIYIPIHSFVDLITNSSSEIFISANKSTIKAFKEIIDSLLKISDPNTQFTADALFEFELGTMVDIDPVPKGFKATGIYGEVFLTEEQHNTLSEDPEYQEQLYEYTELKQILKVTPKTDSKETKKIAEKLTALHNAFEAEDVSQY